jgi:predicted lipoprotein with Yx(FWY)xxD motif
MFLRRFFLFASILLVVVLLAACGSSTPPSSSSGGTSTTATAAPTSSTPPDVVKTATASVKGQSQTILTNAEGKTLYYFTPDTATKTACTGGCAQTWPPLLFTGSGTPTSAATLPGKLSVANTANGNQVEYNGHLLYTYAGDTAAGQTTGEGLFGKWFVCTPNLAA